MSAAVILIRQRRLIQRFRDEVAISPPAARTLAQLNVRQGWLFRRLANSGVFVQVSGERWYLDEDAWLRYQRRRWVRIGAFCAVVAIVLLILMAMR